MSTDKKTTEPKLTSDRNTKFAGTVSESNFLQDQTGGRRFWDGVKPAAAEAFKTTTTRPEIPPCPHCKAELEGEHEEVDIGVGVQTFLVGWRCPNGCPFGFGVCNSCGVPELPDVVHHKWCQVQR